MGESSMSHIPRDKTPNKDLVPGSAPSRPAHSETQADMPPGGSANQEREGDKKAKTAETYGYIVTNQR
jgi:hypothetical protein